MITLLVLAALIGWGLERNHRRQCRLYPPHQGTNGVPDRDLERVIADLRIVGSADRGCS